MGDLNNWAKGDRIGGFVVQHQLGSGYEAVVYLVRDERNGQLRTLKLFRRSNTLADVLHTYQHWQRYAGLSTVKQCLEWGVLRGQRRVSERPWMLLEYIPGSTLAQKIEHGRIRDPTALVIQLLKALEPIHLRGLGIGDMDKGRNVVVGRTSSPWGQMAFIDLDAGTPGYPPPDIYEDLLEVLWLARKCAGRKLPNGLGKVLTEATNAATALVAMEEWGVKQARTRNQ